MSINIILLYLSAAAVIISRVMPFLNGSRSFRMFGKKHVPFFVSQGVYSFLALLILLIIWLDTKHTNNIIKRLTYTKF